MNLQPLSTPLPAYILMLVSCSNLLGERLHWKGFSIFYRDLLVRCHRKAFNQMHQEYYKAMGWDEEGIPKDETLRDLDLLELLYGRFVTAR